MKGREALGADLVMPVLALGFAAYFFISISDLEWEAKANGLIIGVALVLLVVAQLVRIAMALARGRGSLSFAPLVQPREALWRRIGMIAIVITFIATVRWLGVALGLFLAMAAALGVMGVRSLPRVVGIAFAVAAFAYLLFIVALDSNLPRGPVEQLLARLFS
ncbi:MAG: tripartite tricarboxylate transporter TctB family protein [Casimicrobiaceae bacterium]